MRRPLVVATLSVGAWLVLAAPALAGEHTCERVTPDLFEVDGMLDDWNGLAKLQVGGTSRDASFVVRCGYDDERIYLSIRVFDEYVYRSKRPSPRKDDHLRLELSARGIKTGTLVVFPGNDKLPPRRTWNGKATPSWIAAEDTLQRRGWSVELSFPLARIRGLGKASPGVGTRIEYRDSDVAAKVEDTVSFSGTLALAGKSELFRSFLAAAGLSRKDIRLDKLANVDEQRGPERVVAGGRIIGILSDGFFFMELPVRSAGDVSKIEIVDLRGDGTMSILTRYRQHGNGGSRDIVAIWQVAGNGRFERPLAFEVRKQLGDRVLTNRWSLVPKGKRGKKRRGHDIVIEVSESDAKGFDEDNYREVPAPDVRAILTPWSDQTSAVYSFQGDAVTGGGPKPAKRSRRR